MVWINNYVRQEAWVYCLTSPSLNKIVRERFSQWFWAYLPQLKHQTLGLMASLSLSFIGPCQHRMCPQIIYKLWVPFIISNFFLLIFAIFTLLHFISIHILCKTMLKIVVQSCGLHKNLCQVDFTVRWIISGWLHMTGTQIHQGSWRSWRTWWHVRDAWKRTSDMSSVHLLTQQYTTQHFLPVIILKVAHQFNFLSSNFQSLRFTLGFQLLKFESTTIIGY